MKNLESVTRLEENGKYKYIGFMLLTDPDTIDEKLVMGTQLLFFKNIESEEVHYIVNTKIFGATPEEPYGMFQKLVGTFTFNYDIDLVILQGIETYYIEDKDLAKALKEKEENESKEN